MSEEAIVLGQTDGTKVKYIYVNTLLPDNLVDLYTRCVGYEVRSGVKNVERPSFRERKDMVKVI
jgi:hypothetical protein